MNPIEIMNRITMLRDQIEAAVGEERMDDARRMEGQIEELNNMLRDAVAAQDEAMSQTVLAKISQPSFVARTLSQRFLGARDAFKPLAIGTTLTAQNVISVEDPTIEETTIPGWGASPLYAFCDTLAHGTTTGDVKYMRRKTHTQKAAIWKSGQTKAESIYDWEKKTAPIEIIAHTVPVEEPTLQRYGELQNVIEVELENGIVEKRDENCLVGNNQEGIVGVLNTAGIQTYTAKSDDHVIDSIRRMVTMAIMNSRLYPTHIAVAPQVKEAIDLLKDNNNAYLTLMTNGRIWNLPVVEDINLVTTTTKEVSGATKTTMHFGCIVYYGNAATLFGVDTMKLAVGTVNDQFAKNQLTLRMEESNALKIVYPDAFVYCADAIAAVEV